MNEYKVKVTNFDVGRSPNIHITKRLRKTNSTLIMAKLGKVRKSANVNLIWVERVLRLSQKTIYFSDKLKIPTPRGSSAIIKGSRETIKWLAPEDNFIILLMLFGMTLALYQSNK